VRVASDDDGSRCNFDQLLVAALQRTFAFPQMADRGAITEDLHFDVPRVDQHFFDIEAAVAESRVRFGGATRERVVELIDSADHAHAAAAAAGHCFDDQRAVTAGLQERACTGGVDGAGAAGRHGHTALLRKCARAQLIAEQRECVRAGTNEREPASRAAAAKFGFSARKP
jgi:hypothetical protein